MLCGSNPNPFGGDGTAQPRVGRVQGTAPRLHLILGVIVEFEVMFIWSKFGSEVGIALRTLAF